LNFKLWDNIVIALFIVWLKNVVEKGILKNIVTLVVLLYQNSFLNIKIQLKKNTWNDKLILQEY